MFTKKDAVNEINEAQDFYVERLVDLIRLESSTSYNNLREISFNSPTGTGKTVMMARMMDILSEEYFFVVTTLSRGQLSQQIKASLARNVKRAKFIVHGLFDLTQNTIFTKEDFINEIAKNSSGKKIIWIRDEGHITTNRWEEALHNIVHLIINFSATNKLDGGIQCNFTHTMMLRTVFQYYGSIMEALDKLVEVKKEHSIIPSYNPCALIRLLDDDLLPRVRDECKKRKLKMINITDEAYDMSSLCEDSNEYDVIINKFKITEGIDLKRCHVIWFSKTPKNDSTIIQVIGRARRNALLWRNDIDIFDEANNDLLKKTTKAYVYYGDSSRKLGQSGDGEFIYSLSNLISIELLKPNVAISLKNGVLPNGLRILELDGLAGEFNITKDSKTGFNVVNYPELYKKEVVESIDTSDYVGYLDFSSQNTNVKKIYLNRWRYIDKYKERKDRVFEIAHNFYKDIALVEFEEGEYVYYPKRFYDDEYVYVRIYGGYDVYIKDVAKYLKNIANINSFDELDAFLKERDYKFLDVDSYTWKRYVERGSFDYCLLTKRYIKFHEFQNKEQFKAVFPRFKYVSYQSEDECYYDLKFSTYSLRVGDYLKGYDAYELLTYNFVSFSNFRVPPYKRIVKDYELALIGIDTVRIFQRSFYRDSFITSKFERFSKFSIYISEMFKDELNVASKDCFDGKNQFSFPKSLNSLLGYCVEKYAKYLIYGPWILETYSDLPLDSDINIVKAIISLHKKEMKMIFGFDFKSSQSIIKENFNDDSHFREFIRVVVELGTKTAKFVDEHSTIAKIYRENKTIYDHDLSTYYIKGLCDFLDKNTIIDIKVTNRINLNHVKQVLGYYYLSTKRSDLDIKQVIVFDATSGRYVTINVDGKIPNQFDQ